MNQNYGHALGLRMSGLPTKSKQIPLLKVDRQKTHKR